MIDDMVKIIVDPVYPPASVEERESLFELVYSEQPENMVNKRRPYSMDLLYPVPELRPQIGTVTKKIKQKTV
jgi:hypothetical protein